MGIKTRHSELLHKATLRDDSHREKGCISKRTTRGSASLDVHTPFFDFKSEKDILKDVTNMNIIVLNDYRKALGRAANDNRRLIEAAGKSIYFLERTCLDNMVNRAICSPIAVAETKEELIDFCRRMYGDDIPFDDNGKTPTIQIPMGKACFEIRTVACL